METSAIVFERPGALGIRQLSLREFNGSDVLLETLWSGVSTGTEKMLFEGSMPPFPGMGYPLVPGYESVARVIEAGPQSGRQVGEIVFVPGSSGFREAAGLFGATASHLVSPGARVTPLPSHLREDGVLLALAATAYHAVKRAGCPVGLVIGHGVLGRLIARVVEACGYESPTIWEKAASRRMGAEGRQVITPDEDSGSTYACAIDASGSVEVLDRVIARLRKQGRLALAGFYIERVSFDFAPAFMREITVTVAAEFSQDDVVSVLDLIASRKLSLQGLVTHHVRAVEAACAYRTAFNDPDCLKMVIDWRRAA